MSQLGPARLKLHLWGIILGYVVASAAVASLFFAFSVYDRMAELFGPKATWQDFLDLPRQLGMLVLVVAAFALPGFLFLRLVLWLLGRRDFFSFAGLGALNGFMVFVFFGGGDLSIEKLFTSKGLWLGLFTFFGAVGGAVACWGELLVTKKMARKATSV